MERFLFLYNRIGLCDNESRKCERVRMRMHKG